jgi:hypothetical protein
MTFFAAGPSPLARRPSKFTNPAERLARPQQPAAQRPQRVVSQPRPSLLSPGGQGSWTNSHEGPRQGRPKPQQVPLPGAWPGPSVQHHQQTQPAAPSHPNRRSPRSEDAPLPPLPQDTAEPTGESVPSILRPGGPSRQTPSPSFLNGTAAHHHIMQSGTDATYPPHSHVIHQNTSSFPAPQANRRSSPPRTQPHIHQVSSYPTHGTPEHVGFSSGGYATTQPSPQAQPELTHVQYNSQSQSPPPQWQQAQHSPWQQAQSPLGLGQHGGHASPRPPDSHPPQPYVTPSVPTLPDQSYVAASSPAPSSHSYIRPQAAPPPTLSHITTQASPPVLHAQPYAASSTPVVSTRPPVASPSLGSSVPPPQPYLPVSSPTPPTQAYAAPHVPSAQPYTTPTNGIPPTQPYVSPPSSPHVRPPSQATSPSPPVQQYTPPPNSAFPLPTSPPPMPPYGPSYASGPTPSFPTPSFPVPQYTPDYFETTNAPPFSPHDEPALPDPYLFKRYQTPLPLPGGASHPQGSVPHSRAKPRPSPPAAAAPAPAAVSTLRHKREDASERAARELQRVEEESARARREQEERDAELARTLDLELNAEERAAELANTTPPRGNRSNSGDW